MNKHRLLLLCIWMLCALFGCVTHNIEAGSPQAMFIGAPLHSAIVSYYKNNNDRYAAIAEIVKRDRNAANGLVYGYTPLELACGAPVLSGTAAPSHNYYNPRVALLLLDASASAQKRSGGWLPLELARKHSTGTPDDLALIQALIDRGGEQTRPAP